MKAQFPAKLKVKQLDNVRKVVESRLDGPFCSHDECGNSKKENLYSGDHSVIPGALVVLAPSAGAAVLLIRKRKKYIS